MSSVPTSLDVLVFNQPTFYLFLLQGEVLREVVLNGGDDCLKFKFDEDDFFGSEIFRCDMRNHDEGLVFQNYENAR